MPTSLASGPTAHVWRINVAPHRGEHRAVAGAAFVLRHRGCILLAQCGTVMLIERRANAISNLLSLSRDHQYALGHRTA
jgi:hypothetical protein